MTTIVTTEVQEGNTLVNRISSDVLKMNFMRRTTVRMEQQRKMREQQERRQEIDSGQIALEPPVHYPTVEHIDDDPNCTLGGVTTEWRYTVLQNLRFGRFSFKGQNPEIEKLMLFHERRRLGLPEPEEENTTSGEENSEKEEDREDGELHSSADEDREQDFGPPEKKLRFGDVRHRRMGFQGGLDEGNKSGRGKGQKRQRGGGRKQRQPMANGQQRNGGGDQRTNLGRKRRR